MGSAPGREIKLAVMPAYSRSKNGVAFARLWRGHPRLAFLMLRTDVDGRDKPGHDEPWVLRKGGATARRFRARPSAPRRRSRRYAVPARGLPAPRRA